MFKNRGITIASVYLFLAVTFVLPAGFAYAAGIKSVLIEKDPAAVRIRLTKKVPWKVVQFDKKEILVAFRKINSGDSIPVSGNGSPLIRNVNVSMKKAGVASIVITTGRDVKSVSSVWIPAGNTLVVKPVFAGTPGQKKTVSSDTETAEALKNKEGRETGNTGDVAKTGSENPGAYPAKDSLPAIITEEASGFRLGDRVFDERFEGSTDDLFLELRTDACEDASGELKRGLILCKQGGWNPAYEVFSSHPEDDSLPAECIENIAILKAYTYFRAIEEDAKEELADETGSRYLEAAEAFQKFISCFPGSVYLPYALTCLGKIYERISDYTQAEGYFKIVLKVYYDYPGTPEVMFELGRIYGDRKKTDLAKAMLTKVVKQFPNGKFISNAKLTLGKALFNQNDFYGAIKMLEEVMLLDPRMVFSEPDLLQYLGNAFYHTTQYGKARDILAKVYNIFPYIEGRDTILSRIGDTYVEDKNLEKAISVFRLVVEKYPGTDGFVISSMRLAEFLESYDEKKELYDMIIRDYPDNPLSRLAMMRLALLAHKAGNYKESVETIKQLLATQPRALRTDAINLLLSSSEEIFKKQLSSNEYTALLKRFEDDKRMLNKSDNPEFFLLVGLAYLKAHLYDTAIDQLMKSYKRTGKNKRPPELFHALGKAMKELGRTDEAYDMLKTYDRCFRDKKDIADVHFMMGDMLIEKKKYKEAAGYLEKAVSESDKGKKRAAALVRLSVGYRELKENKKAVGVLVKAINMLAGEPEESYATLSLAHKNLGDNYMSLKNWDKAADAFNMAIKFAGPDKLPVDIYFMLGEAYEKAGKFNEAVDAYNIVTENGDSFWSSMAGERLREIKLKKSLKKT